MKDLMGHTYGDLVVIGLTSQRQFGSVVWVCRCKCGREVFASSNKLRTGNLKSCGCRRSRVNIERNIARTKHGHAKTYSQSGTYKAWRSMITRCEDPRHRSYPYYGGRGVRVCSSWRRNFQRFLTDMGERPDGYSLDREDPHGDYSPSNCRWVPLEDQPSNQRRTVYLAYQGHTRTLSQWAREMGCKASTLRERLRRGWPVERALTEPVRLRRSFPSRYDPERKARSEFKHRYRHLNGDLTYDEWLEVLRDYDHACRYCGATDNLTMDHLRPLSKGGLHTKFNVAPACRSCNSSKRDR